MTIFYEVLLAVMSAVIIWFALYVVYRLLTDDS
jgi:hypothetical protein